MTEPTIICPKFNAEIKLNELLAAPLIASHSQVIGREFQIPGSESE